MNETEGVTEKRAKQRALVNKFIDTPVEFLIKHSITPDVISYIGLVCMIIAAIIISLGTIHMCLLVSWIGPFFIFLAGAFDVFDGEVARRTGKEGPSGAFLDSILDRISDIVLILGLVISGLINYFWGLVMMFLCIMISYTRSKAEIEGINMKGVGFMERAERILIIFGGLIIETWVYLIPLWVFGDPNLAYFPLLTTIPVTWFWVFFIISYIFALSYTLLQRIFYSLNKLKALENP